MPYWRLSNFYFFYFASLGALLPYWTLYLQDRGFSALQIGELMAVLMATKIVAPNIWGWIADHTGHRMRIVRLGSLLALVTFGAVFWVQGYWPLALVMFAFSFFWNASLPQFEATTLTHLGNEQHRYSRIRLWGSIGFIVAVVVLGAVLDAAGAGVLPFALFGLFAAIWLSSLAVPESIATDGPAEHGRLMNVLKRPEVLALLVACFFMQASFGPYYTFFTIYMEGFGYTRAAIGQLWAIGVVAEVGIFLLMHRLLLRYTVRGLLLASLLLASVRWVMIGAFPQHLVLVLIAQTLHAASFAVYHAAAVTLFHRFFAGRHHGQGQALYSSLSFGMGGALGSYYSGVAFEAGGADVAFYIAAALSAAGFAVAFRWLRA